MNYLSIEFSRSFNIEEKADMGEKMATIGLGLLRIGFGKTVRVRKIELINGEDEVFFEKNESPVNQRIVAIALAILLLPLTALLAGMGLVGIALSKSYKNLVSQIHANTPEARNKIIEIEIQKKIKNSDLKNRKIKLSSKDQFVVYNRKTEKYVYIAKAPPIKNLVISGGGAKGVILPGILRGFEKHPFIEKLDYLSGSSVGAITAALIATGITAERFNEASKNVNFEDLLGKGFGPVFKCGTPLVNFLRRHMQESIRKCLEDKYGDLNNLVESGSEKERENIQKVLNVLKIPYDENGENEAIVITFSMLRSLHVLDPVHFKDLTVTALCRETGETEYFDADNQPDLDIATACRASASLPIIMEPVQIGDKTYSDGGYLDNIPVKPMQNKQGEGLENKGEKGQNLQTLALVFDEADRRADEQSPFFNYTTKEYTVYYPSVNDSIIIDIFAKIFGGIFSEKKHTEAKEGKTEEIRKYYVQRNIPLLVPVDTTAFKLAKDKEDEYTMAGEKLADEYLTIHKNELIYRTFDSLDDLVNYVPEDIREEILQKRDKLKP